MVLVEVFKRAAKDFVQDRVLTYAAALAFYSALSLPPILVVLLWVLGAMGNGAEQHLRMEASRLIGPAGRDLVDSVLRNSGERVRLDGVAGVLSSLALAFSATGVFAQLQTALNRVWEVRARPGSGVGAWVRKRLLSFGLLGVVAFLMLVSLAASTLVSMAGLSGSGSLPAGAVNWVADIALFTVLFAAVFRLLPDVRIQWRDVWAGAAVTAVLFAAGKWAIGAYLAHRGLGSAYGAAGSAIVALAWVYFSAAIVFFGAELTQAWVRVSGRRLEPDRHAVRLERAEHAPAETAAGG